MLRFRKRGRDAADLAQAAPSPVSDVDRDVSEIIKKVRLGNLPGELRLAKDLKELEQDIIDGNMRLAPLGPTSIEATVRARRDSWPASLSSYLHPGAAELSASRAFAGALANSVVTVVVQVDKYYPHVAPRVSCTSFGLPVGSLAHAWVPGIGLEGGRTHAGLEVGGSTVGAASSHHGLHAGAQQGHTGDRLGRVRSGSGTTTFRGGGEDGMGLPVSVGRTAVELARLERKSSKGKNGLGTSAESAASAGSSVHQGEVGSGSRQSPGLRTRSGTAMSPSDLSAPALAHTHAHAARTNANAGSFAHGGGSMQAEGAHTAEGWVSPGTLSGRWARSEGSIMDGPVRLSRPPAGHGLGLGLGAGGALSSPAAVSSANGAQAQDMDQAVEGATVGTAGSAGVSGSVSGSASEEEEDEAGVRHGVMGGGLSGGAGGRPFTRNSVGAPGTILEEEDGYAGLEEDEEDQNSSVLSGGAGDEASMNSDSLADGDSEADANASVAAVGHVHHNGESTLKKHPSANSSNGGRRGGGGASGVLRPDRLTDDMCVDLAHLDHRESTSPPAPVTAALRQPGSGMQARPWGHMADESSVARGSGSSSSSHAGMGSGGAGEDSGSAAVSGWRREGRDRAEERAGGRGGFGAALARTAQEHAYGGNDRGRGDVGGLPQGLLTGVAGDTGGQLGSDSEQADGNTAVTSTRLSMGQEAGHISQVALRPGHPVRLPLLAPSEWRPTMSLKDVLDAVRDVLTLHTCRGVLQGQGQAALGSIGSGAGVSTVPQQGLSLGGALPASTAMEDDATL